MIAAPFVTGLRTRPDTVRIGADGAPSLTIRAQLAEAWDAVRIVVPPDETVAAVKQRALAALDPRAGALDGYIVTFRGIEILDEDVALADARIPNGATLFIARRRRRPVR